MVPEEPSNDQSESLQEEDKGSSAGDRSADSEDTNSATSEDSPDEQPPAPDQDAQAELKGPPFAESSPADEDLPTEPPQDPNQGSQTENEGLPSEKSSPAEEEPPIEQLQAIDQDAQAEDPPEASPAEQPQVPEQAAQPESEGASETENPPAEEEPSAEQPQIPNLPMQTELKDLPAAENLPEENQQPSPQETPVQNEEESNQGEESSEDTQTEQQTPQEPPEGAKAPEPEEEPSTSPEMTHVDFDLLDTEGRWLLKVLSGPNTGAEFSIHGGSSYLIGTDTQACDIVFQDLSVSRKHARLTIDVKESAVLEDLKSRNGTFVDGERIEKKMLSGNVLVSMGTTTFMLIDREAEQTTIVAGSTSEGKGVVRPPPIATEKTSESPALGPIQEAVMAPLQSEVEKVKEGERLQAKLSHAVSSLVILAVVTGLIMTIGIGGALLFRTQKVESPTVVNPDPLISKALSGFPAVRYSYNPTSSRLLLVGHVSTVTDRSRLLDVVTQLKFIRDIDYSNVVIDDQAWGEFNQVLAKNPAWRGISVTSPSAGRFILTGFLRTRAQAEELFDYVSQNFPYVDLLERRVVVEEELLGQITRELGESGFQGVIPSLSGGNLTLTGSIGLGTKDRFTKLVTVFKAIPGIRSVQILVSEAGQKEAVIDLSSKYMVTGYSKAGNKVSVVINGRILATGDTLDGLLITEITQDRVFLEKNGVKYKIDFNS